MQAPAFQILAAALGVGEKRIAAVDNHIAFFEEGGELVDDGIDGRAGFHHDHRFAGTLERTDEFFHGARGLDVFPVRFPSGEFVGYFRGPIEDGDRKTLRFHIEDEVFAHDRETDQSDITLIRVHFEYLLGHAGRGGGTFYPVLTEHGNFRLRGFDYPVAA
jgi:hypothetical protein